MLIVLKQRIRSDEFRILSNEYELLTQVKNTHPTYSNFKEIYYIHQQVRRRAILIVHCVILTALSSLF